MTDGHLRFWPHPLKNARIKYRANNFKAERLSGDSAQNGCKPRLEGSSWLQFLSCRPAYRWFLCRERDSLIRSPGNSVADFAAPSPMPGAHSPVGEMILRAGACISPGRDPGPSAFPFSLKVTPYGIWGPASLDLCSLLCKVRRFKCYNVWLIFVLKQNYTKNISLCSLTSNKASQPLDQKKKKEKRKKRN